MPQRTRVHATARLATCVAVLLGAALCRAAHAGDWPQILGPQRNGHASDEAPVEPWGSSLRPPRWTHPLGEGFAGPAVAGNRIVAFHRVSDQDRVVALDARDGTPLWQTDFPALYRGGVNPDLGPRCVPLIHGQRVYLFGAAGQLHCVGLADGEKIWSRDLYGELQGREGYFGAGSTPLLIEGRLLVNVGGRGAGLVALDPDTGKTLWAATDEGASYASPTAAQIAGRPVAIFVTRLNALGVLPASGEILFRFPFGATGPTVNAATPLVFDDRLFVSASYGVGARLARLNEQGAEMVWQNDDVMASQYTTCVYTAGHLYGAHGREDYGTGELRCVEAATGQLRWSAPQVGVAHVILVHQRLLVLNTEGQLRLVQAAPDQYRELAQARVTPHTVRALPALANGVLYFRDQAAQGGTLYALEL